ncbi:MAG: ShlB/FhaC/HecB family hemolysin secretion/activation protein [Aliishimia sp.]
MRDPGDQLLKKQTEAERRHELERSQAGQEIRVPDTAGVVPEGVCFPIDSISLAGVKKLDAAIFESTLAEFSNQCLGPISIGNLIQRLAAIYADAGYITTRAYVPAQDISSRVLKIEVLEGKVEAYIYQSARNGGEPQPGRAKKLKSAIPLQPGDVFQLRDLEHGLEQMNRVPSSRVNANLIAGEAPGTTRIVVTEQKSDTVRGSVGIDNSGDEESGKNQIILTLEADDIFRINDTLSLSFSSTRNSNAVAYSFSAPYRKWLFGLRGSYSESLSPATATSDLFNQSSNLNLTAERLIYRDARSKYFLYGGAHRYKNKRFINITPLQPQDRTTVSFGWKQEHRLEKSVVAVDTSFVVGAPFLGGESNLPDPDETTPRAEFTKLEGRLTYVRPFENGSQLTVSVTGQLADTPLFSNEQISIGGWQSVRGYAGGAYSGDDGAYLRAELSFPGEQLDWRKSGKRLEESWLPNPFVKAVGGIQPFVFFDAGYASNKAASTTSEMYSAGFGFNSRVGGTSFNGTLAVPLSSENDLKAGDVQDL